MRKNARELLNQIQKDEKRSKAQQNFMRELWNIINASAEFDEHQENFFTSRLDDFLDETDDRAVKLVSLATWINSCR